MPPGHPSDIVATGLMSAEEITLGSIKRCDLVTIIHANHNTFNLWKLTYCWHHSGQQSQILIAVYHSPAKTQTALRVAGQYGDTFHYHRYTCLVLWFGIYDHANDWCSV
jgi:hypothetical protein